jgi:iron complex outermembrane receptor protein/vitamin B12 transporter
MTFRTIATIAILATATSAVAQQATVDPNNPLQGKIHDALGAAVAGAKVELITNDDAARTISTSTTTTEGQYSITGVANGQYRLRITAKTFAPTLSAPIYLTQAHTQQLDLTLDTPTRSDEVTVTATGTPTPLAQSGAPITVLTPELDFLHSPEVQQPLRLVPGVQMVQVGETGGVSSLLIRGGQSEYNKVLIDGVPVNDIGGDVDFANLATVGISRIEVLRQPNSVLYGSDDLSGVVQISTTRGATPLPLFSYAIDGGNLGFFRQQAELSGLYQRFDYYTGIARLQTQNDLPDDEFHNLTATGNYGFKPDARTDLRFIWRHLDMNSGDPNAIALYGIPDFANQRYQNTYLTGVLDQQPTPKWHNLLRYGHQTLDSQFIQYGPDGTLYVDPINGPVGYLGLTETIRGGNGYSVTGQGILDYVEQYPSTYNTQTYRDFVYAQTDYRLTPHLTALGSFQYDAERGNTFDGYAPNAVSESNYSYTLQIAGDLHSRLFYTLGSGIEDNAVYGKALTPRATLAYYLIRPGSNGLFTGTKLHASFGKGVKEGSIPQQANSLYDTFLQDPNGPAEIAEYHTKPLGAEYSRTYDFGVEQQFANGRARVNLSLFHNEFTNGIQFVSQSALIALGIPAANAAATEFGAYVNSQAYRAMGAELESEFRLTNRIFARAGYTYLDPVEQRSFSSDALSPSFNYTSSFSNIPIGIYAPLDGARPFRLAPHSGYFSLSYSGSRLAMQLTGTLVGRRDDSDFLTDQNYGTSLLLPNRNLDPAYQRLAFTADYRLTHHLTTYADLQNLLNQHIQEAFGYPGLPFNLRGGFKFTFGGESFHLR